MSLGDNQQNPTLDYTSSDDDIFENDEFSKSFNKLNNLFEDYLTPDFKLPLNLNEFTDN